MLAAIESFCHLPVAPVAGDFDPDSPLRGEVRVVTGYALEVAKAGIVGLTRAVAREVGRYGITCNAYAPTAATRFTLSDEIVAGFKKRYEAGLMTKKRYEELTNPPKPETVGPFIVYLCTDEAADINGQVFDVTGGNIALYSEPVKKASINKKEGLWTVQELIELVPGELLEDYKNPAPAEPAK